MQCRDNLTNQQQTGCEHIKRERIGWTLVTLLTMLLITPVTANDVGAYNVKITQDYVMSTAKCSCSLYTNYNYHTRVFYNYNPATHKHGVLQFEQGAAPHTSPEWFREASKL